MAGWYNKQANDEQVNHTKSKSLLECVTTTQGAVTITYIHRKTWDEHVERKTTSKQAITTRNTSSFISMSLYDWRVTVRRTIHVPHKFKVYRCHDEAERYVYESTMNGIRANPVYEAAAT